MIEQHLMMAIEPWDDPDFRGAAERALAELRARGPDVASEAGAAALETRLRQIGYPHATVSTHRSVDDALAHRARFIVRRGSP
jgi:hypothetical protein